jgi:hypothetical protein
MTCKSSTGGAAGLSQRGLDGNRCLGEVAVRRRAVPGPTRRQAGKRSIDRGPGPDTSSRNAAKTSSRGAPGTRLAASGLLTARPMAWSGPNARGDAVVASPHSTRTRSPQRRAESAMSVDSPMSASAATRATRPGSLLARRSASSRSNASDRSHRSQGDGEGTDPRQPSIGTFRQIRPARGMNRRPAFSGWLSADPRPGSARPPRPGRWRLQPVPHRCRSARGRDRAFLRRQAGKPPERAGRS